MSRSNRVYIYKKGSKKKKRFGDSTAGGYTFPAPAPTVAISTAVVINKSKDSYAQGTPDTHVFKRHTITFTGYFCDPTITPGADVADYILGEQESLRSSLEKDVTIDINTGDGTLLETFDNCNPVSLEFPEGQYVSYGEYSVTFESEDYGDSEDIIEYSWDFQVQENTDMGYFNSDNHTPASNSYVTGSETVTATGKDVEKAKDFVDGKVQFDGGTVYIDDTGKIYDVLSAGTSYTVCNLTYNSSVDVTTATVTYASNFILVPSGKSTTVIGSLSLGNSSGSSEPHKKGICSGSLRGLSSGSKVSQTDSTSNANSAYTTIKSQARSKLSSYVTGTLRTDPVTENVTRNFGAGTVDFTLEYDTKDNPEVSDTVYEKIEITEYPTRRVHAVIPVMGRASGPVIQDTYAVTEKRKDFSIEVVYEAGKGGSSGPGTLAVENANKPTGSIIFESSASTTWNSSERRFVRQKTWVYE